MSYLLFASPPPLLLSYPLLRNKDRVTQSWDLKVILLSRPILVVRPVKRAGERSDMAFVPYGPSHWEALTVVVLVTWLLVRQGRIWERAGKLPLWRSWSGWAAV